jgi:hypothetical protein
MMLSVVQSLTHLLAGMLSRAPWTVKDAADQTIKTPIVYPVALCLFAPLGKSGI